jgi:hypothetical protein
MISIIVRLLVSLVINAVRVASYLGQLLAMVLIAFIRWAWRKFKSSWPPGPPSGPPALTRKTQISAPKRRVPQPLRPKPWM